MVLPVEKQIPIFMSIKTGPFRDVWFKRHFIRFHQLSARTGVPFIYNHRYHIIKPR